MRKKNFSLEHDFNNLRRNSYLKITRIFLFCASIMYCKWGYLATEFIGFSNEEWWVRPVAIIPSVITFIFSFKSKFVRENLAHFTWISMTWLFINYIYFIIYQNNANVSSVIGVFIVLFGIGMFLRHNKELFINGLIIMPTLAWALYDLDNVQIDKKMVLLSMLTNYVLIGIFLYAKNYFISKTSDSYRSLKVLIDAGNPTLLTEDNKVVYSNDKFLSEFNFKIEDLKYLNFDKIYKSKDKMINERSVDIEQKDIVLNKRKLKLYIFKDITCELRNKEKDRQVAQMRSMREITGNLAHEINNPLMILKMATESLHFVESEKEREKLLSRSDETIERMKRTMLNLKILAKDVSNEVESKFFVEQTIEDIFDIVKFRLEQFSISYEVDSNLEESVCLRKYHLYQVLLNLINNSIDSLSDSKGENKKIFIRIRKDNDGIKFLIEDNGKGISLKEQSRIFKPFYTNKKIGTGMGLTIALDLLEDIGGNLKLEESKTGKTVFSVSINESTS